MEAIDISALLKAFIYLISSSLLYPVLLLLVILTLWIIVYAGAFIAERLERLRLAKMSAPGATGNSANRHIIGHGIQDCLETILT